MKSRLTHSSSLDFRVLLLAVRFQFLSDTQNSTPIKTETGWWSNTIQKNPDFFGAKQWSMFRASYNVCKYWQANRKYYHTYNELEWIIEFWKKGNGVPLHDNMKLSGKKFRWSTCVADIQWNRKFLFWNSYLVFYDDQNVRFISQKILNVCSLALADNPFVFSPPKHSNSNFCFTYVFFWESL